MQNKFHLRRKSFGSANYGVFFFILLKYKWVDRRNHTQTHIHTCTTTQWTDERQNKRLEAFHFTSALEHSSHHSFFSRYLYIFFSVVPWNLFILIIELNMERFGKICENRSRCETNIGLILINGGIFYCERAIVTCSSCCWRARRWRLSVCARACVCLA